MNEKPTPKVYYSIGQVADMFGVKPTLIRYWEKQFDEIKPIKNKKGDRQFSPADVDTFHLIYYLVKENGMTLKGTRARLKVRREETERVFEIVKRLKEIKKTLLAIRDELPDEQEKVTRRER
jgi:DNA-binding transcriptional MerR regulator